MQEISPSEAKDTTPPKTDALSPGPFEIHKRGEVRQPLETPPQVVSEQADTGKPHVNGAERADTYTQRLARSFGISTDESHVSHPESKPLSSEQYAQKVKDGIYQMVAETGKQPVQELTPPREVSDNSNVTKIDAVFENTQHVLDTLSPGKYVLEREHVEIVTDPSGGPTRFSPASDKIYINIEQSLQNGESSERIAAKTALAYVHESRLAEYYAEERAGGNLSLTEQAYVDRRLDQKAEALALTFDAQRQLEHVQRAQGSETTLDVLNMPHTNDLDDIAARYSSISDTQGRAAAVEMLREELQEDGQLRVPTHDFQEGKQQEQSYEQHFRDNWQEMPADPEHSEAHIIEERSDTYMPKKDKVKETDDGFWDGNNTPEDNQRQNKDFDRAAEEIGKWRGKPLSKDERRRLHEDITKQGFGIRQIVEWGKGIFSRRSDR